jgi:hypothetical protein
MGYDYTALFNAAIDLPDSERSQRSIEAISHVIFMATGGMNANHQLVDIINKDPRIYVELMVNLNDQYKILIFPPRAFELVSIYKSLYNTSDDTAVSTEDDALAYSAVDSIVDASAEVNAEDTAAITVVDGDHTNGHVDEPTLDHNQGSAPEEVHVEVHAIREPSLMRKSSPVRKVSPMRKPSPVRSQLPVVIATIQSQTQRAPMSNRRRDQVANFAGIYESIKNASIGIMPGTSESRNLKIAIDQLKHAKSGGELTPLSTDSDRHSPDTVTEFHAVYVEHKRKNKKGVSSPTQE